MALTPSRVRMHSERAGDGWIVRSLSMRARVRVWIAVFPTALVLTVSASAQQVQRPKPAVPKPARAPAPPALPTPTQAIPFNATALEGEDVQFPSAYKGKLVLLMFWATWCPHCRDELKSWREAYDKFREQGLEMIGLPTDRSRGASRDKVAAFVKDNGLVWQQIYIGAPELSEVYGARSVPWAFLIDADTGRILAQREELRNEKLVTTIERQLAIKKGLPVPTTSSQPAATQPATSQPTN
jgi:cytochrome c biogenesis protein CcmG, thiol:disulfide interchange protein DsbE